MFSKPFLIALCIAKHSLLLEQGADSFRFSAYLSAVAVKPPTLGGGYKATHTL